MTVRILLADDHGIVRNGLRSLLEKHPDMEVVAEATDGRMAIEMARELLPHVVLMDINMANLNGVDATHRIVSEMPEVKVIALSMHSSRRYVSDMLKAGVSGYVLKDCVFDELAHAIRMVVSGQTYLSPRITGVVVEDYINRLPIPEKGASNLLTDRQREVLQLIAEGKSTKQIAQKLDISTKTVEANRRQIMLKLETDSVADLTKYAIREGLTTLES